MEEYPKLCEIVGNYEKEPIISWPYIGNRRMDHDTFMRYVYLGLIVIGTLLLFQSV